MEAQLKELIDKIKEEGVKTAEEQAAAIIREAEKKAAVLLDKAGQNAEKLRAEGKKEAEKYERTGKEALSQAARDVILLVQSKIEKLFDELLKSESDKAFTPEVLQNVIVSLIESWSKTQTSDLAILISKDDFAKLEENLRKGLAEYIKKGFELKASDDFDAGFRVSLKDGSAYYNFSSQGIAELLSEYLNPKLKKIMSQAAEE